MFPNAPVREDQSEPRSARRKFIPFLMGWLIIVCVGALVIAVVLWLGGSLSH